MMITVNGRQREIADGQTLTQLLNEMKLDPQCLAIERNRVIVERETFETTLIEAGDQLEIIQFVGGG